MIRSLSRRLRRTLSFRGRSKRKKDKTGGTVSGGASSNWENDALTIKQQGGVSFTVKYLGCLEVSESRGTQVCSQAAHQMKMSSAGKKKQRVTLWVTEDTLRVTDDETKSLVVDQVIEKVSFCTPDPHDEKLFSYICRDGTSRRWLCHSFKGIKDSGERISHAVGCAFAACLAKKQQQNQNQQNLQRGASTRKTLESRPNGVKLPQQSVDTLQKLNETEYTARIEKANHTLNNTSTSGAMNGPADISVAATPAPTTPQSKQPPASAFAPRPRPSGSGSDIGGLTRHASLPYRAKKSAGSSTYQALTEDPLPPRLPTTPPPMTPNSEQEFWLNNTTPGFTATTNTTVTVQTQANPFSQQPVMSTPQQPFVIQQQAGVTPIQPVPAAEQQSPNPFVNNANPFTERFV